MGRDRRETGRRRQIVRGPLESQGHGPEQSDPRAEAGCQFPDGSQERRETGARRHQGRVLALWSPPQRAPPLLILVAEPWLCHASYLTFPAHRALVEEASSAARPPAPPDFCARVETSCGCCTVDRCAWSSFQNTKPPTRGSQSMQSMSPPLP